VKPKGVIRKIGYVDENNQPQEWTIDCGGNAMIPALEITDNGEFIYAGYSVDELKTIGESTGKFPN